MFYTHFNHNTQLFTIYYKPQQLNGYGQGKQFSSFTYTTLDEARKEAASLQHHFFGGR